MTSQSSITQPSSNEAGRIVGQLTGEGIRSIERFPTGLCHHVYDVVTGSGRKLVVRIAQSDSAALLAGGVHWSKRLRPCGVPLPELIKFDLDPPVPLHPHMVLQRLEGTDLGHVYRQLSACQKRALVADLVRIQAIVQQHLPEGAGYGCGTSYDAALQSTWGDCVRQSLNRARGWIRSAGIVNERILDRMERLVARFESYFASVRPRAFLDDTTTKNVIIGPDGSLSGIVDVDEMGFGDMLSVVGLTQMALLSTGQDLEYIRFWCEELRLDRDQLDVVTFYTAKSCVFFLGEIGQAFNKATPEPVDGDRVRRLMSICDELMGRIGG